MHGDENQYKTQGVKEIVSSSRSFLMGLSMIAVVLFHERIFPVCHVLTLFRLFGNWGVDFFLFLSGFGCAYALGKYSTVTFYRKRILRILPTCAVVGTSIVLIGACLSTLDNTYLLARLLGINYWYIQAILVYYLLAPMAYLIIRKWKAVGLLALAVAACVTALLVRECIGFVMVHWFPPRATVFFLGIYIGIHDLQLKKWHFMLTLFFLCAAMSIRIYAVAHNLTHPVSIIYALTIALCVPVSSCVLVKTQPYLSKIGLDRIIVLLGVYSLEIYVIHERVLGMIYWLNETLRIPEPYAILINAAIFLLVLAIACKATRITVTFLESRLRGMLMLSRSRA